MELFQIREKEIFDTLKNIKESEFVVIGGYAVNSYTLPRFSVDCDIVVKDERELKKISKKLLELNYSKEAANKINTPYYGEFERYEKTLDNNFKVSIDILFKDILDRQTNATFSADWVFKHSKIKSLIGKTIHEEVKVKIVDIDALFAMKMISCRSTDIRDIFMLIASIEDKEWIKQEVSKRFNFNNRFSKIKQKIISKQFKDGLQGVYGIINDKVFDKHKNLILKLDE